MSRLGELGHKLYTGEVSIDFIKRRKTWYLVSVAIIVISVGGLWLRGVDFSIEFRGGADFQAPVSTNNANERIAEVREAVAETGLAEEPIVTAVGNNRLDIQTPPLDATEGVPKIRQAIADELGVAEEDVNYSLIGPSWGGQITAKALQALGVFLVLVMGVIWLYFREWRMSVAAIVALIHDLVITVGIYALIGFEVTPATVIGVLTILGYSLYDTVVVFDKVRENTRGLASSSRVTYSDAANLAVNQTLVRSINTSIIALLPVAGILFIGTFVLGAGTLKDLSLALFIGLAAGTYSSIFTATPLLCDLKEREPAMKALRRRVEQRQQSDAAKAGLTGGKKPSGDAADEAADEAPGGAEPRPAVKVGQAPGSGSRTQPQRKTRSTRSSRRPKGRR
ncbi:protein translocase subunit SecF [Tenggerimyces flavus]|uniref:Protein-export membrane protein SecF n=1 Tax=Tenggerimyces flavus TaxID=1708749 RepID=A0ABV7YDS7_9ACTN|nr:protein translocase subunit SecF [Tenggerimyces flavus]MBM7787905.1 preprotein translocase subunit SecF [Tenggerimyces flavus]